MSRTLTLNESLYLILDDISVEEFSKSICYKLKLRRYVDSLNDNSLKFKDDLTYTDYKKIISILQREFDKVGITLNISQNLSDYIDDRETHINIRCKVGNEIKHQNEKYIERFKQYKSTVNSLMVRNLREKQVWDSFFMCAMKRSGNFSVPGSGKTASVLGVYAYLKSKSLVKRILVICPKNAFASWIDEFGFCFGDKEKLNCFNIHSTDYRNTKDRKKALKFDTGSCNLILVNYESMRTYREELISLVGGETMLVFDEVHKVKRINGEMAVNALDIAQNASYVIAMTGTPVPNTYMDIYNFLNILFPDDYREFFGFAPNELRQPHETVVEEINEKLRPFFCRTTKNQLGVPKVNKDKIHIVNASEAENKVYSILKQKYRKNQLALLIRLLQLESNPRMLLQKLDLNEFAYILNDADDINDIDFVDYSNEIQTLINSIDISTKKQECINLIERLVREGKPVIVWCIFVDSINSIAKGLNSRNIHAKCIYGEVPLEERQSIVDDFRSGKYDVIITNPHTLAESVSLHSVCHDAVYFEYSYNLVHLLQSKDRIHRLGLDKDQYTQYYYMQQCFCDKDGEYSLDERIYNRLLDKEQIMLNAIDSDCLEIMPTNDDELDIIFEGLF